MKKLYYSFVVLLLISVTSCNDSAILFESDEAATITTRAMFTPESYFWSGGQKNLLEIDPTRLIVRFDDEQSLSSFASSVSSVSSRSSATTSCITRLPSREPIAVIRQELMEDGRMDFETSAANKTFAKTFHGSETPFYLTGEILLRPKRGVSAESIMNRFEIDGKIVEERVSGKVIIRVNRLDKVMDIANAIYTSGMVEWCHPNFATIFTLNSSLPSDEYFHRQFYLRNSGHPAIDINVVPAWNITQGCCCIRVAVIDSGVEDHIDIDGRVLDGYTPGVWYSAKGRPSPHHPDNCPVAAHGQAVAGIIAAEHNFIGIAGIAPLVNIVPINIFYFDMFLTDVWLAADGIDWAWDTGRADVINNSWGFRGRYIDVISQAIHRARTYGRNGRGTVVVTATGNSHDRFPQDGVYFPASVDGVIAVGAIERNGITWNRSGRGPQLDLVAPSGAGTGSSAISTTDRMGDFGVVPGQNFRHNFGGTSAAAPQVAGVAALMLSVNPYLTEYEVRRILIYTARQDFQGFTQAVYRPTGRRWSPHAGYGLVNAYAAVRAAYNNEIPIPPPPPPPTIHRPVISGPAICCPGASATFSIPAQPAGVAIRWIADAPLSIQGANNQRTVTVRHTGTTTAINSRITVEVSWDGQVKQTVHHTVLVNRPTIHSLHIPPTLHVGDMFTLFADHNSPGAIPSWSVSPYQDLRLFDTGFGPGIMTVQFMTAGNYTITAWVANACGSSSRSENITVIGTIPGNWCRICFHFPIGSHCPACNPWWRSEEEEEENNIIN